MMIHGNELCQNHLITGAPHCVNPSLIKLLGVCLYNNYGEDLRTSCYESFYAHACESLVLCYTHGNELRQIHLITGVPHGINPSLIIC